ncbi:MAG: hypothetical protein ACE367_25045 [Acidimicrobiales bacterium]
MATSTIHPTSDPASAADATPPVDNGSLRAALRRWNERRDLRRARAAEAYPARSREVLHAASDALRSAPYGRGA